MISAESMWLRTLFAPYFSNARVKSSGVKVPIRVGHIGQRRVHVRGIWQWSVILLSVYNTASNKDNKTQTDKEKNNFLQVPVSVDSLTANMNNTDVLIGQSCHTVAVFVTPPCSYFGLTRPGYYLNESSLLPVTFNGYLETITCMHRIASQVWCKALKKFGDFAPKYVLEVFFFYPTGYTTFMA